MPLAVKDFSWEESEQNIFISVPLKGVALCKVDIFSTEKYIKVHYPPYLFECFLYDEVSDSKGAAEVGNGSVFFKLDKKQHRLWTQLQTPDADDKEKQRNLRAEAQHRFQVRIEQEKQHLAEEKRHRQQFAVRQQIQLEQEMRQRIENTKQTERELASRELEKWKEQQNLLSKQKNNDGENSQRVEQRPDSKEDRNIFNIEKDNKTSCLHEEVNHAPVRNPGTISIKFTPRTFPTPSRESLAPEEQAWLKKQTEARRVAEIEDKDLSEEEKNPTWLRDKGVSFFKAGNIQAAINVFTHAIRLDGKMPSLYSNRSACHLKLGNYIKCAEDCSKALELLTPPVAANASSRCKVHVRRGTAFCHLELYVEGLLDYDAALKINPDNEELKIDADNIRKIIQSSHSR